jgi:multisubunit Na+/H+ antiporter MnhB subunit
MLLKTAKFLIQIASLTTMSLLFFAIWQNPDLGFSAVAGLALASLFVTQWTIQKAWRISEKSRNVVKMAQITALVAVSLSFATTGLLAGAEYSGLDSVTGVKVSQMAQEPAVVAFQHTVTNEFMQASQSL